MFVLNEISLDFKASDARNKQLVSELIAKAPKLQTGIKISSSQLVFPNAAHKGKLYLLRDGMLSYAIDGQTIFYYEAGDLVGLEHLLARSSATVQSDFAVVVDQFDGEALIKAAISDKELCRVLNELLVVHSTLLSQLCFKILKASAEAPPEIRTFGGGEIIVAQGGEPLEVYTLVEGEAVVDEGVASLKAGDIFGVVAALNGVSQPHSIKAQGPTTVVVITRENFIKMIESRPATMLQAVEGMARTLVINDGQMPALSLSRY